MNSIVLALALLAGQIPGTFALQSGTPSTTASLRVSPLGGDRVRLDFAVRRGAGVVRAFDVDMTQVMHVVVVADDFTTFAHLHPHALANGHLVVDATAPPGGYHVYADSRPHGSGQQVFRFDVGDDKPRVLAPTPSSVSAGPYVVRISTLRLRAGRESELGLTITRNGRPASDLQTYLGAAGHAIFLNAGDLTYAHVHPSLAGAVVMDGMDMESGPAQAGPRLTLHANVREAGTYKLWFEFRGGGRLYVAPFVVVAS